jgi:PPK2 family polyphosphate:nucleotide phosphotransferase
MDCTKLFRVKPGSKVKLSNWDPSATHGFKDKDAAKAELAENVDKLEHLQTMLYGEGRRSLLLVLQGMDTSGKDGTVRHVFSGLNPTGVEVTSFGKPSERELDHDFLWRIHARTPRRGMIGVFNRSHYEDVLVVRVANLQPKAVWSERYDQINDFEAMLTENGTTILKCFLHISKDEQRTRLQERLKDPEKNWKFQPGDLAVRKQWDDYQAAYEDALTKCSTPHAPWHIIPANNKWFRNLAVSELLVQTLEAMDCKLPKASPEVLKLKVE